MTESLNIGIIGSSAGGPRILKELFDGLPLLDGCVIIVQHMPKFINESLRRTLDDSTEMTVCIAQNGDQLEKGYVYLAPSEIHLELVDNRTLRLREGEKVNFVCPSVDVTMKSVARPIGAKLIGIILTGMGKDGAKGIRSIKRIGGITIAQDKKTSIIYGMPKEAYETGAVDYVLSTEEIRLKLIELLGVETSINV